MQICFLLIKRKSVLLVQFLFLCQTLHPISNNTIEASIFQEYRFHLWNGRLSVRWPKRYQQGTCLLAPQSVSLTSFLWQEEYCAKVVKAKLSDFVFFLSRKSGKALQVFTTSNILAKFRIHWSAISSERKLALEKLRQNENSDFAAHWRIFPGNGSVKTDGLQRDPLFGSLRSLC